MTTNVFWSSPNGMARTTWFSNQRFSFSHVPASSLVGGKFRSPPHLSVSLKTGKKNFKIRKEKISFQKKRTKKRILLGRAVVKTHHGYSFARRTRGMLCRICVTVFISFFTQAIRGTYARWRISWIWLARRRWEWSGRRENQQCSITITWPRRSLH